MQSTLSNVSPDIQSSIEEKKSPKELFLDIFMCHQDAEHYLHKNTLHILPLQNKLPPIVVQPSQCALQRSTGLGE